MLSLYLRRRPRSPGTSHSVDAWHGARSRNMGSLFISTIFPYTTKVYIKPARNWTNTRDDWRHKPMVGIWTCCLPIMRLEFFLNGGSYTIKINYFFSDGQNTKISLENTLVIMLYYSSLNQLFHQHTLGHQHMVWIPDVTCMASSLVGVITKAWGPLPDSGGSTNRLLITGMRKASILPLPVWALAIKSRLAMMMGIEYFWIGVGVYNKDTFKYMAERDSD